MVFGGDKFACCRPNFTQLPMGHTAQLVFASVPDLIPVPPRITSRASPSVLEIKRCSDPWSVSFVTTNHESSTRRSTASFFCILHQVPCQARPGSPTRAASFPTDLASDSSAPPAVHLVSMDSLECFVACLMPCRHSLQLLLQSTYDSFSNSHESVLRTCQRAR